MAEALEGIPRIRRITDDFVAYDETWEEHVRHVTEILMRCAKRGISLNYSKFQFGCTEVEFGGYILSTNGYKLDPDLHEAVANFRKPSNITDLRSFFGLVNHLSDFTDVVALKLEPLRPLLKPRNDFLWEEPQERAFQDVKKALSTTPVMAYYDSKRATSLHVDASMLNGLGFVLKQQQPDGSWRMVQAGSRFITETEQRYAMIKESYFACYFSIHQTSNNCSHISQPSGHTTQK